MRNKGVLYQIKNCKKENIVNNRLLKSIKEFLKDLENINRNVGIQ